MSKVKVTMAVFVAALALSAMAAASASAGWFVNGAELKTSAALATTAQVDTDATLTIFPVGGSKIKVLCKGTILSGAKPEINANGTGMAESLTFEGCETTEPSTKCALTGQPTSIKTNPVTALVTLLTKSATADRVTFEPLTKKTFAEVPFSAGNTCAFGAPEPINGSVTVGAPTGQDENAAQLIEGLGSVENNSLEVAGAKAFIEGGKALLKLASGSQWSFV